MDIRTDLLHAAREADVERAARRRRLDAALATCRRRILGIFAIERPCDAATSAC